MEYKAFGKTGHTSSRVLFGAAAFGEVSQKEADETLALLLDNGINHIDTARSYGEAELRIGPWMKKHRSSFFLASKTNKRTKEEALEELKQTLKRLQTDHLDLWQLHYLVEPDEWETAMGEGGALEAAIEAKEQGLVRFIGVTGHGVGAPSAHLKSLEVYDFDSVLLPYNYSMMQNSLYREQAEKLFHVCKERSIAVQTIKSLARGELGDKEKLYATWYDPLTDEASIRKAVHWVLSNEQVFLNSTGDIHILPHILKAAQEPIRKPSDKEMEVLVKQEGITPLFS
ncbi:MAG: aldo/keto reductase [Spirochaetaceae bacterium]|uniref:Aldo/keto reductase n=1 Tax=Sphaerochaeta halotolerans TaxID=2293840 RepID=A0A372MJY0_9SPIR|nr:aldo/keto reductase [Sphaerochaeta halotolerans]MBG0766311.1 aldo/keto reductase [Spirochaetaceae bacterium]RFU96085.1 aldo/keto reductase [Sphaerochaeta halotolerans]